MYQLPLVISGGTTHSNNNNLEKVNSKDDGLYHQRHQHIDPNLPGCFPNILTEVLLGLKHLYSL